PEGMSRFILLPLALSRPLPGRGGIYNLFKVRLCATLIPRERAHIRINSICGIKKRLFTHMVGWVSIVAHIFGFSLF
ncbi:MAG: hypothetical protein K2N13_06035, partial [Paraprevotella sp.]|nr:hypothetical protein [Paraprevotella sp.]